MYPKYCPTVTSQRPKRALLSIPAQKCGTKKRVIMKNVISGHLVW